MTNEELKRVNIRVTPEVYEWFMNKSKRTGVSMSSLMFLALEAHVQQQLSIPYTTTSVIGREMIRPNVSSDAPYIVSKNDTEKG